MYESAAQVDVGGDVYDFLELGDGRLAVVLGDVTGHGIDATADMAMAKFVFRSLAREHPEPADFLAHANEVVVGEIALGKFITMAYVDRRPRRHGSSRRAPAIPGRGSLGPTAGSRCSTAAGLRSESTAGQGTRRSRAELAAGRAVVLYTDGVVEARSGRELFGVERLDARARASAGRGLRRRSPRPCSPLRAASPAVRSPTTAPSS